MYIAVVLLGALILFVVIPAVVMVRDAILFIQRRIKHHVLRHILSILEYQFVLLRVYESHAYVVLYLTTIR